MAFLAPVAIAVAQNGPQITAMLEQAVYQSSWQPTSANDVYMMMAGNIAGLKNPALEVETVTMEAQSIEKSGINLYRSMKMAEDGLPEVGASKTKLGVVFEGQNADIIPDSNGMVHPNSGGMSLSTNPYDMPTFRRPPEFGGTAKGQNMFCLSPCNLSHELKYVPDPSVTNPGHGYIGPSSTMPASLFQDALAALRQFWKSVAE